ncbi:hypothetical protein [Tautonia plasticadhaerens]|uniref:Uncharacterized protein n=1 Tax=Tautonia plasticadhaerens TaxID=2527974 RepID=A0A518H8U7_9BACT|nr:hypothetical protein [Tautonia plasticadhaerens]QDV37278.1 hypothetical protein ElP_52130 [Tautonia plasticadhaerens]
MPILDESDGRSAILASNCRLVFLWAGDRWRHALEVGAGDSYRTLASSMEGEADPTRVVGPAYQQMHLQHLPDQPEAIRAFLVGQSGPHHFSAVFTISEDEGVARIDVEVADRCRAEVVALASTYVVDLPTSDLRDAGPAGVSWELSPGPSGSLSIEADTPSRIDLREAGCRGVQVQAAARVEPGQATVSWSYSWRLRVAP